jgi:hypothetical protein
MPKIKPRDQRLSCTVQTNLGATEFAALEIIESSLKCSRAEALREAVRRLAASLAEKGAQQT